MAMQGWEAGIAAEPWRPRPLAGEEDLADLCSLRLKRTSGQDGTFSFLQRMWVLQEGCSPLRPRAPARIMQPPGGRCRQGSTTEGRPEGIHFCGSLTAPLTPLSAFKCSLTPVLSTLDTQHFGCII
jgi:hypothetical protein